MDIVSLWTVHYGQISTVDLMSFRCANRGVNCAFRIDNRKRIANTDYTEFSSANSQSQQATITNKIKHIAIFNFKGCSLRFYVFGSLSYIFLKKSP